MKVGLDENGQVVSEPFDSVEELIAWNPENFSFNQCKALQYTKITASNDSLIKGSAPASRPQMLVCHDMSGGYLDDRFGQGCCAASPYRFCHWQLVDTFVYFSHHFVTVPPVGWIKAAHKHGVNILGTIITEWDEGAATCKEILQSESFIGMFTTKLAQLAQTFGFDGWLINIENKIEAIQIPKLLHFVHDLTSKCRAMLESPKVIWYDSVINSGELKWQDELNDNNRMFFEACDGIFLNYCVTTEKLVRSHFTASKYGRQFDVYVGVDAYGRGTPGGGGFNCREVVKMIQDHGLSTAIFAPGWTYEKHDKVAFDCYETMFWALLGKMMSSRAIKVPFATSFCQGYGEQFYLDGQSVSTHPWYNVSLLQIQPTFTQSQFVTYTVTKTVIPVKDETSASKKEDIIIDVSTEFQNTSAPEMSFDVSCGYLGGGSLKLSCIMVNSQPCWFKLFKLDVDRCQSLEVSVIWKNSSTAVFGFALVLNSLDGDNTGEAYSVLDVSGLSDQQKMFIQKDSMICVENVKPSKSIKLKNDFIQSKFVVNTFKFSSNSYKDHLCILSAVLVPNENISSSGDVNMCIHLGHLTVEELSGSSLPPSIITHLCCWNTKVVLPLAEHDLHRIITHPIFSNSQISASSEEVSTSFLTVNPTDKSALSLSATSFISWNSAHFSDMSCWSQATNDASDELYILKWTNSCPVNTDYVIVSSYDQLGHRKLIGQTAGECFVSCKLITESKPVSFSVQPVIFSSNTPGDETTYKL